MNTKQMKPYGYLHTHKKTYLVLNPEPLPKDSQWNDGTYTFFVAQEKFDRSLTRTYSATHVVTNSFALEYADLPSIDVDNVDWEEEYNDVPVPDHLPILQEIDTLPKEEI